MPLCVVFLFFLILIRPTENRRCLGVSGWECCNGFALDTISGECKKCPIGYFSDNCSRKCNPPTYGEDCQYLCECSNDVCHFALGCQLFQTFSDYQSPERTISVNYYSFDHSTLKAWIKSVSYPNVFSTENNQPSDTTITNLPPDNNLFKNDLLVHFIISLVGIFVFFFAIFVLTYIYLKCVRKTTYGSGRRVKENELQIHYKELSFDAVEPHNQVRPEQQGRVDEDFTYLTPVLSRNERRSGENEDEILPTTQLQEQRVSSQENTSRQNEQNITHDDAHVYIEITEEQTERSKLDVVPDKEKQDNININHSLFTLKESAYTNITNEEI